MIKDRPHLLCHTYDCTTGFPEVHVGVQGRQLKGKAQLAEGRHWSPNRACVQDSSCRCHPASCGNLSGCL